MKVETLHIANTNFEFELSNQKGENLQDSLEKHPLTLQLQFLPVLYADRADGLAVTHLPNVGYSSPCPLVLFNTSEKLECRQIVSWGFSRQIQAWAKEKNLDYSMPSWNTVGLVNSKVFSFENSPKLRDAMLLYDEEDFQFWIKNVSREFVLKCAYGVSGRGNLIVNENQNVPLNRMVDFCKHEWERGRPVIAEPWMDRMFDFSTQWQIEKNNGITFIGTTVIKNDARGGYSSTISGREELIFSSYLDFLEEHKIGARAILSKIQDAGYFGPVGIDSMIYKDEANKLHLQPVVEVNARQTMSLAALLYQRKHFPNDVISLSYTKKQDGGSGLLPEALSTAPNKQIIFKRQLYLRQLNGSL